MASIAQALPVSPPAATVPPDRREVGEANGSVSAGAANELRRVELSGAPDGQQDVSFGREPFAAKLEQQARAGLIRRFDRRLATFDRDLGQLQDQLERVKLYPPYPPGEPRRAALIRRFNGMQRDIARLVPKGLETGDQTPGEPGGEGYGVAPLSDAAPAGEVEARLQEVTDVRTQVAGQRKRLVQEVAGSGPMFAAEEAERMSKAVGLSLARAKIKGLTGDEAEILRRFN
jgi:hypothetical protein